MPLNRAFGLPTFPHIGSLTLAEDDCSFNYVAWKIRGASEHFFSRPLRALINKETSRDQMNA